MQDILSASDFMRESGFAPQILVGHSLGGTAVLKAARHIKSVQAVVTIGSPFSPAHVADHLLNNPENATYVGHMIAAWSNRYLAPG